MKAHLLVADPECTSFLAEEVRRAAPSSKTREVREVGVVAEMTLAGEPVAFARQVLPEAREVRAASINAWADSIVQAVAGVLPDDRPWRLHLWPRYGEGRAGENRCRLIRESLVERLKKRRRHLLRSLRETTDAFDAETSLVQVLLVSPEEGWLSVCAAPEPQHQRALLSTFVAGEVPVAEDKSAPSRAFAKLVEAEQRLGLRIGHGETCVDLGASPGSWSYVALQRGAEVIAVDRSELREDLMEDRKLRFVKGDAFKFKPDGVVDWLLCDVIAAPQRNMDLLVEWLREKRMRKFVVTVKFKGSAEYPLLDQLKREAAPLCWEFRLTRLSANKNEVCAFGVV